MAYGILFKNSKNKTIINENKKPATLESYTSNRVSTSTVTSPNEGVTLYEYYQSSVTLSDFTLIPIPVGRTLAAGPLETDWASRFLANVNQSTYSNTKLCNCVGSVSYSGSINYGLQIKNSSGSIMYDSRVPLASYLDRINSPAFSALDSSFRISYTIPSNVTHVAIIGATPSTSSTAGSGWTWNRTSSTNLRCSWWDDSAPEGPGFTQMNPPVTLFLFEVV